MSRPSFLVAEYDEAAGVENGRTLAGAAIDAEAVSVPAKITDVI
ncbi:hypothetical protein [Qipengyuania sp. NPDC077563]